MAETLVCEILEVMSDIHLRLAQQEQQLNKHREQLAPMEADIAKCRMECDMVYPGTSLTVGALVWSARELRRYCKIVYDVRTGELKEIS